MARESRSIDALFDELASLPDNWHAAGMLGLPVLREIHRQLEGRRIRCSAETGTGRSTLLMSHLSDCHYVFALDLGDSLQRARESPLLNARSVRFIEGPSQRTVRSFSFPEKLQFALIDGPHAFPFPFLEYWALYPHLEEGALLVVDDIHIPTINWLYQFLLEEPMFEPVSVVVETALFRRTSASLFDPFGEGWWLQPFNERRFPMSHDGRSSRAKEAPSRDSYRARLVPLVETWRRRGTRVAVFGIGPHTGVLLDHVPELEGLPIVAYLDSDPAHEGHTYRNRPIEQPAWAGSHVDLVVCSSFEHEMTQLGLLDSVAVKVVLSHLP